MRNPLTVFLCVLFTLTSLPAVAWGKGTQGRLSGYQFFEPPPPTAHSPEIGGSMYQAAAAETTVLGWWQFDDPFSGVCDPQGWTVKDRTSQDATYFHVDGNDPIDPGCHGITPINGQKSMWCGQWASTADPWCGWETLPGYGNSWEQLLVSDTLVCDTLNWSWTSVWDSEPGYDLTYVEYYDATQSDYVALPVNGGVGYYDGAGGPQPEGVQITPPTGWTILRYRFVSDGGWSDEDGLWPTNEGAFKVDDIAVMCQNGPAYFHDFEAEPCGQTQSNDGFWEGEMTPPYGIYARLVPGATVLQEDPCVRIISCLWAFFDDPSVTNYACGGHPLQGAVPYGPDESGLYIQNELWSPWVPITGSGDQFRFEFLVYRDLPLDALLFYVWGVRGKDASGCPGNWGDYGFVYYGGGRDWLRSNIEVGPLIPGGSIEIQMFLGVWDMCQYWCGIYGTGSCHTHAPLFDQVRLVQVDVQGPQWSVRHIDLLQDNFPEDGTVTGTARADMAIDMLPNSNPSTLPGDSAVVGVMDPNGFGIDPQHGGPSVYMFVRVTDRYGNPKAGKNGLAIQSPDNVRYPGDPNAGVLRYPYCGGPGNPSAPPGLPAGWGQYRMDEVYTAGGGLVSDRFCADLMDISNGLHVNEDQLLNVGVFTPTDVIWYFLGAKNAVGLWSFWHRTLDGQGLSHRTMAVGEAAQDPCEFSILPDAGLLPGDEGDILYVDDCDDRGGPAQLYFDWAFRQLSIEDRVDRFDVLGPSSVVGNSLASRVQNFLAQIIGDPVEVYQKIVWNSGNLSSGLIGDGSPPNGGSGPEKSDDFALLNFFLTTHPNNPGVYAAGDDLAGEWVQLTGAGAVAVRGTYMNYNLVSWDHRGVGEPITPLVCSGLPGSYPVFDPPQSPTGPDCFYVYGGCPLINDFDVMGPTGLSKMEMSYTNPVNGAVLAQATPNGAGTTARFVLAGFGYNYIRDDVVGQVAPDRVEFLRDILVWFENIVPDPVGIDPLAFRNRLHDAYPNPFNPTTTIKYEIKERAQVTLKIYNVAGQLVRTLVDDVKTPKEGGFAKDWHGLNDQGQPVSSGVYFYKLVTKNFTQTKKMVLLK